MTHFIRKNGRFTDEDIRNGCAIRKIKQITDGQAKAHCQAIKRTDK